MKVLFLTNIPSPYRVNFFNELGKLCDLTVVFEKSYSSERDAEWKKYSFDNFKGIILDGISTGVDNAFSLKILKYLNRKWDCIITATYSTPTGMLAIQYMKSKHIPYWIEGDGGFAKSGKGLKERIKKHFISGAVGYFSTSKAHDNYYLTYGARKEQIFRYPFTSIYSDDIINYCYSIEEKMLLRKKLNMSEEKIIITIGQFIPRKGFDILLKSSFTLPPNMGFYFIGGTPTQDYIDLARNKHNIHFVGFKRTDELKKFYLASDLFVLPTREDIWGLVINEAMACGLPIITTDKCIAGLELVENGKNGYIVPVDSPEITSEKIIQCFESNNLSKFGNYSIEKIKDYTFENMAKRHIEILSKVINK